MITITPQPDDVTCGPTSLHAVYRYFGYDRDLTEIIRDVRRLEEGGTIAAYLGIDALIRGFDVCMYSYELHLFDPSWSDLSQAALIDKLHAQAQHKKSKKFRITSEAYIHYLELGGTIRFDNLTPSLLADFFDARVPVLAGLSATFLYGTRREFTTRDMRLVFDDIRGEPSGHFVVLYGTSDSGDVLVADPYRDSPFEGHLYEVDVYRLINAILLGIVTYDANLLIISPKKEEPNLPLSSQEKRSTVHEEDYRG